MFARAESAKASSGMGATSAAGGTSPSSRAWSPSSSPAHARTMKLMPHAIRTKRTRDAASRSFIRSSSSRTVAGRSGAMWANDRLRDRPPSNAFELFECTWPVFAQDPAHGAIRQDAAAGLAARAVVGLPVRIDDPLHRGVADRAGLAVPAVDGHLRMEDRDFLRETLARLPDPDRGPLFEGRAGRAPQPLDLVVRQVRVHLERRETRAMEDLVGERAADPREGARVGQRPLEGVTLAKKRRLERREAGSGDLDAARVERGQRFLTADEVESRPALRPRLHEEERAGREVERRQPALPRNRPGGVRPAEPSGDHQMDREEEVVLEGDHDSLPEPPQADDGLPRRGLERRIPRGEERDRPHPDLLDPRAADAGLQGVQVGGDLGELGHGSNLASGAARPQASNRAGSTGEGAWTGSGNGVPRSRTERAEVARSMGARLPFIMRSASLPLRAHAAREPRGDHGGTRIANSWKHVESLHPHAPPAPHVLIDLRRRTAVSPRPTAAAILRCNIESANPSSCASRSRWPSSFSWRPRTSGPSSRPSAAPRSTGASSSRTSPRSRTASWTRSTATRTSAARGLSTGPPTAGAYMSAPASPTSPRSTASTCREAPAGS